LEYLNEGLQPPSPCTGAPEDALATPAAALRQIKYNGYTTAARNWSDPESFIESAQPPAAASARRVVIEYESRPDTLMAYRSGFAVKTGARARQIQILTGLRRVRAYQLSYQPSSEPGQSSLLQSVQEMGADDTASLPPTQFEYTRSKNDACATDSCM